VRASGGRLSCEHVRALHVCIGAFESARAHLYVCSVPQY
jgi:hypothetical protein